MMIVKRWWKVVGSRKDRKKFRNILRQIKDIRNELKKIHSGTQHEQNIREGKISEIKLQRLQKLEETTWFQRSRALWLKDADKDTFFFLSKANQRRKRNIIEGIRGEGGVWYVSAPVNMHRVLNTTDIRITDDINSILTRSYTAEDIHKALKQMHLSKSPGPDVTSVSIAKLGATALLLAMNFPLSR
ncbi:conserved hypothetical protein [Ricinus communis]|uniref:Uncharacterized protein n=1 Tax=Ricinus communis TaxID=3988 RepID=B9T770_RICCO|nr:conserved hypothetical protein [Ricinus communis]